MSTTLTASSDTQQLAITQQRAAAQAQNHSPPPAGLISPRQRRGAGGFADQSAFDHPFEPQLSSSLLRVRYGPKYRDPFSEGTHSAAALALAQSRENSPTRRRWRQQNGSAADDAARSPKQQQLLLTSGDANDSSMRSDLNESEPARDTPVPTPRHTLGVAAAAAASSPAPPVDPLDVDGLSEQIMFDMQALGSLKAERDALHKKAASTMTKLREQEEILRAQRTKSGAAPATESNEPSTAAKMQSIFDTQMQAYNERVAELEFSVHEAAKRMALEQQRQQQQQQQQLQQQPEAQSSPASASRTHRDTATGASIASPQATSAANHSLSSAGHVFTPAPPLDFAETPALAFSDPSALLESKMLEGVLPLHLHKGLVAYKASVVARVTARDQQLAQQAAQRLRETQKDAARQYRALADTYAESLHAASLQSEELAHYKEGVAFFEQQLRESQAQLAESEDRRRELTAHFERVQADHAVELQSAIAQSAAAAHSAENTDQPMPTTTSHPYSFVAPGSPSTAAVADTDRASLIAAFHADISARDARIVELDNEIQSIRAFVDSFAAQDPAAQTALQLRDTQQELVAARQQIAQLSEALSNQQQAAAATQPAGVDPASTANSAPASSSQLHDHSALFESERSAWVEERASFESRLQAESAATANLREELAQAQHALADSTTKLIAAESRASQLSELPAKLTAAEAAASNVPLLVDQLNQLATELQENTRALDATKTASADAQAELAALRAAHSGCAATLKKSQRKLSTLREARSEFEQQISQMERAIDATSREVLRMASGRSADAERIRELEEKLRQSLALQETMAKAQLTSLQQTKQAMRSRTQRQLPQPQPQQQQSESLPSAAASSSSAASFSSAPLAAAAAMSRPENFTPQQLRAPFTPLPNSSRPAAPTSFASTAAVACSPAPFVRDDLAQQLSELQALRQSLAADPVTTGTTIAAPRSAFNPAAADGESKEDAYRFASAPTQQQQQPPHEFASPQQQPDARSYYPQTQQRPQQPHQHESYFLSPPAPSAAAPAHSSSEGSVIVSSHTIPAMTVQTIITPVRPAVAPSYAPAATFTPQPLPSMPMPLPQPQPQPTAAPQSGLKSPPWAASLPTSAAPPSSSSNLFRAADAFLARQEQDR